MRDTKKPVTFVRAIKVLLQTGIANSTIKREKKPVT
jgi:hypothetical protein